MISNCGKDEHGRYTGGKPGDQTGKEWHIIPWYNRPWNCVLRFKDKKVANLISKMATNAANNDNIGYSQSDRYSFWEQLKKTKYNVSKIKTPCNADCSSGVYTILKAIGYRLDIKELKELPIHRTYEMRSELTKAGASVITGIKYTTSDKYLLPGDILLNDSHHTAINITRGECVDEIKEQQGFTGVLPSITSKTNLKKESKGINVKRLQEVMNYFGAHLEVDGSFGPLTEIVVKNFQKYYGLKSDGIVGTSTMKKIKELIVDEKIK